MDHFKALVAEKTDAGLQFAWMQLTDADLMDGDVSVRITHSTINYKDGLVLTGKMSFIRRFPLIPGIDFAGIVEQSSHPEFKAGDAVVLNGFGIGESHHGGYSQRARVKGDWLVKRPDAFTNAEAMAIGTAGYTSMLSVIALENHGVTPQSGPILVTGAAGGVGSVAVAILAKLGFEVIASTGRPQEAEFLKRLGARQIIDRAELASGPGKPLAKERWAGAVEVAGSFTLANCLAATRYGGCVAASGLAQGVDLPATVLPFILRGVTLAGIDSVMAPKPRRVEAWRRLAQDLDRGLLASLTVTRPVEDVVALAPEIIAGHIRGRVVLEVA